MHAAVYLRVSWKCWMTFFLPYLKKKLILTNFIEWSANWKHWYFWLEQIAGFCSFFLPHSNPPIPSWITVSTTQSPHFYGRTNAINHHHSDANLQLLPHEWIFWCLQHLKAPAHGRESRVKQTLSRIFQRSAIRRTTEQPIQNFFSLQNISFCGSHPKNDRYVFDGNFLNFCYSQCVRIQLPSVPGITRGQFFF